MGSYCDAGAGVIMKNQEEKKTEHKMQTVHA